MSGSCALNLKHKYFVECRVLWEGADKISCAKRNIERREEEEEVGWKVNIYIQIRTAPAGEGRSDTPAGVMMRERERDIESA